MADYRTYSAFSCIFALSRRRRVCLSNNHFHNGYHLLQLLLFSLLMSISIASAGAEVVAVREVRDLQYGEVLFHFYQGDYFTSITHLQAARQKKQLPNHQADAELLLGGLMLSYGLHDKAEEIFKQLLDPQTDSAVHDRAWFYLAKLRYQLGEMTEARNALEQISPTNRDPQYRLLLTDVLMAQGEYQQVIDLLSGLEGSTDLFAFSRYNLGVALIKNGHVNEGINMLNAVGAMDSATAESDTGTSEEILALQDKANLALGYYYIQQNNPQTAQTYLERVRLNGMFSARALLGMGWAESASGLYQKALVPWDELSTRNVTNTSVQEALLAMPYALEKLQAYSQAVDHYHNAIDVFKSEIDNINSVKKTIERHGIADKLLQLDPGVGMGWLWQLRNLPQTRENQYLFRLLADYKFQVALKNYRDLRYLDGILDHWASSMPAFNDILALRRDTYNDRLPKIQAIFQQLDLDKARQRRDIYAARLARIEQNNDALGLATAKEKKLWARLQHVNEILARHSNIDPVNDYRHKQRLLKGLFIWRLDQQYKLRLWEVRKHLKELDKTIAQAQLQRESLLNAQQEAPAGFEGYSKNIDKLRERLSVLKSRVAQSRTTQERFLQRMVIDELENREAHLRTYLTQAQYGLAQIFDTSTQHSRASP